MNPGILTSGYAPPQMPGGLLGSLRPIPTIHTRAYDADAGRYIDAVEIADGQQLETAVAAAINSFVVGCKTANVWDAIRAACILCGARTLPGALTPLAGSAPTNNNFVSADYNRRTGLVGNASNKWLTANRAGNADPAASCHCSVWVHSAAGASQSYIGQGNGFEGAGSCILTSAGTMFAVRSGNGGATQFVAAHPPNATLKTGFIGASRDSNNSLNYVIEKASFSGQSARNLLQSPNSTSWEVFGRGAGSRTPSNGRLRWYSIGPAVNVGALGQLVDALMVDLQAALP